MRRIIFLLLTLVLVGPKTAFPARSAGKLNVKAAMVTEFGSGRVLFMQDPDKRIAPASVTKIMTMYVVFDAIASGKAHLTDRVKVSHRADATGGSTMNLKAGETVSIDELLRGMAVASGNDACIAIAEHFGGIPKFVSMMNQKARELGMTNTTFVNPNGLPAKGQLTTARDLTKLATSYLHHYPQALHYHSTTEINHRGAVHANSNRLLGAVDGVDGIKTGFVCSSGFNIVVTAKRNGNRIIAVVLGGQTKEIRNHEATRIVEAAYSGSIGSMLAESASSPEDTPRISHRHSRHHHGNIRLAETHHSRRIHANHGASSRFDTGDKAATSSRRHAAKKSHAPRSASRHTSRSVASR